MSVFNEEEFHRQVAAHIKAVNEWFIYTPTEVQIYEFAKDLYSATFVDFVPPGIVEKYNPDVINSK